MRNHFPKAKKNESVPKVRRHRKATPRPFRGPVVKVPVARVLDLYEQHGKYSAVAAITGANATTISRIVKRSERICKHEYFSLKK
jgi:DNA invertase Pin-like site-specific DNA recombinase